MSPSSWSVHVQEFAEADLHYLKHHHKNVLQHVRNRLLPSLVSSPEQGSELKGDLRGCRAVHFWNDRYRLAYSLDDSDPEDRKIYVLAVGLKDGFYDAIPERLKYMRGES